MTRSTTAVLFHAVSFQAGLFHAMLAFGVLVLGSPESFAQAPARVQQGNHRSYDRPPRQHGSAAAVDRAAEQPQPRAPFQLNQQEERVLDQILLAWQLNSDKIKTFECDFSRWEYQPDLGPRNKAGRLVASTIAKGQIKFLKPDKGLFQVKETLFWKDGKFVADPNVPGEHWACDGQFVYEVNRRSKAVFKTALPPQMQGKHISEGPLPFLLFGAEAAKLKARYFMREKTDPRFAADEVWLESYPKWRGDAANFKMSQLIMKRKDFLPYALRLYSPNGKDYSVFEFKNIKINNFLFRKSSLGQPSIPRGYKLIERNSLAATPASQPPSANRPVR